MGWTHGQAPLNAFNLYEDISVLKLQGNGGNTYSISGHIEDSNLISIPGVNVTAGPGNNAVTDNQGNYTISNVFSGNYTVTPNMSGYIFTPSSRKVTLPPVAAGVDFMGGKRSIWVWGESENIINNNQNARNIFFSFLTAPHGNPEDQISTVYMYIPEEYITNVNKKAILHDFLQIAADKRVAVDYLSPGEGKVWVTSNDELNIGKAILEQVFQFNSETTNEAERFKGIHLDIEPAENIGWDNLTLGQKKEYWLRFYELLSYCRNEINTYNTTHPAILFGVDLPTYQPWYGNDVDQNGIEDYKDVLGYVDILTTMDYSDHSYNKLKDFIFGTYGLITRTDPVVTYAQNIGKRVIIGVETQHQTVDGKLIPETRTFYEEGWIPMESELNQLTDYYLGKSGFNGTAIHNYKAYQSLYPYGSTPGDKSTILAQTIYLSQKETKLLNIPLDLKYKIIHFVISWVGSTVNTSLIDPNGRVITPSDADTDPKISHYTGSNYEIYIITDPIEGAWQAQLYGADLPQGGEEVNLEVFSSNMNKVFLPITLHTQDH